MSQPNPLLYLHLDPSTPSSTPHPLPYSPSTISTYKQTIRRYGSQNFGTMQTSSLRREPSIEGPLLTSPANCTTRKNKKSLDFFSAALDDFKNAKRLSMSSNKTGAGGLSTRAGTMTSMSRTLKSTRTPQSFTSLASENLCFNQAAGSEKDNGYPVSSLHDVETRTNLKINTLLSLTETGYGNSRNDLGSINLTPGLETLEFVTEGALTQRSYRESEVPQNNATSKASSRRQKAALLFKKEGPKSSNTVELNARKKMKKPRGIQNKEVITEVSSLEKEVKGDSKGELEGRNKRENVKVEPKMNKERGVAFDRKKMCLNLRSSQVTSENPSIQKSQIQDKKVLEIQTPRADTIENIEERTQEIAGTSIASLGRRGLLAKRLEAGKNIGTKSVRTEEVYGKKESQVKEDQDQAGSNGGAMSQAKRPSLRRMKSEVQRRPNLLEIENLECKIEQREVSSHHVEAEKEGDKAYKNLNKDIENVETVALDQEEDQDVRKIDNNRRKRLEEWIRLKRKEEGQDQWMQDLCEEGNTEKDHKSKFELYKQGGRTFFELNLDNKFIQKYDFLRTQDDNLVVNTEENCYERTWTENPCAGNSTLESIRNERSPKKALLTETLSRMSKSEKHVKTDPSTMMVRYFDELNPLVIQPKFMESTGSMCVTELWGNKSKQDFYKVMRKPLEANTIFSLNPQPGIYRPEKPGNQGDKYKKRWLNAQDSKENETKVSESLGLNDTPTYFKSRKGRHTRAFVLQGGTSDMRPKTGYHSRGLSSKLG